MSLELGAPVAPSEPLPWLVCKMPFHPRAGASLVVPGQICQGALGWGTLGGMQEQILELA